MSTVGGAPAPTYRSEIWRAHAIALLTRISEGCGRVHSSRFSGRLSSPTPLTWLDGLPIRQVPAKKLLGHEDVLEDVPEAGARMIGRFEVLETLSRPNQQHAPPP